MAGVAIQQETPLVHMVSYLVFFSMINEYYILYITVTGALLGWVVCCFRICIALTIFQSYCDFETGYIQYLRYNWRDPGFKPRTLFSVSQDI